MSDKLEAFRAYDFDSDEGFKNYARNVEIPGDQAAGMLKLRAKWYRNNVDSDFEVSSVQPATSRPAAHPQEPASTTTSSSRPMHTSPPPPRPSQQQSQAGRGTGGSGDTGQLALFALQAGMLLLFVAYMQPLVSSVSYMAYRLFLASAVAVQFLKVYKAHGIPSLFMNSIKAWATEALPSADFSYLTSALVFLPQQPITLLLIPFLVKAAYGADAYASQRLTHHELWRKYGARVHQVMVANKQAALGQVASTEILLGFLLVIFLLTPQRSIVLTFLQWNTLKMRYWLPETGAYHRQAWASIDQFTFGLRQHVPFLNTPIGYVQKWFMMRQ